MQVLFATRRRHKCKNCQCQEEEMFTKIYLLTPLPHIQLHITSVVWRYPNVTHATALFGSADKQNISYVAASMFVVSALHCSLSLCPDLSCVDTSLCREPAHHRQKELFSRDKDPPLLQCYATQEIEVGVLRYKIWSHKRKSTHPKSKCHKKKLSSCLLFWAARSLPSFCRVTTANIPGHGENSNNCSAQQIHSIIITHCDI